MKIRKAIVAVGVVVTAAVAVVTVGAGAASAAPKECAALNLASMRAARLMDFHDDLGNSEAASVYYTTWVAIEGLLAGNNC